MNYLKSFLFNSLFYVGTALIVTLMLPVLLLPSKFARMIGCFWGWLTCLLLKIVNIKHVISGDLHLHEQVIYAVKHQSAWETIILTWVLGAPAFVLKRELLSIPVIGWFFQKTGCIPVDRSAGMRALLEMRSEAIKLVSNGRSILIFPQGTRVPLHSSTKDYPYQSGIYFLYSQCNIPVIPVAHNAGLFWPKNSFLKYPDRHKTKTVTLEIMDEIPSGLDKKTFMDRLEKSIEDKTRKLIQEECDG